MSVSKTATGGNKPDVLVRRLTEADCPAWLSMRQALWMGTDATTFAARDGTLFTEPERYGAIRYEALVALIGGRAVGFIEVSLRDDIEGFADQTVAYVEGVFVEIAHRGTGLGSLLIAAALDWMRSTGAVDLVSDVTGENPDSVAFHQRSGFRVVSDTQKDGKRHVLLVRRAS